MTAAAAPAGSAASRVADALRERVVTGDLKPGTRLSEERVRERYGVSRSTLREAYQLLIRERLLVHELSRGVFVRRLSRSDLADLYEVRRIVECAALRRITGLTPAGLRRVAAAVSEGRAAVAERAWDAAAAANIRFHEALVALAGSERLDVMMGGVLAEFRLAYAHMDDAWPHAAYVARHAEIAEALGAGDIERAATLLHAYLGDSAATLLDRYAG